MTDFSKFYVMRGKNNEVPVVYMYIECNASFLNRKIPQAVLTKIWGESENDEGEMVPNVTEMDLKDFSLSVKDSVNKGRYIVTLGAKTHSYGRLRHVDDNDAQDWLDYIKPYGFDETDCLTREEAQALIKQPTEEEI